MKLFNAETVELKNGLKVIVVKNKLTPAVTVGVLYHVGAADDPTHLTGVSHFLEHMMFKGTKDVPGEQFQKEISACGGYQNAWTSYDWTLYFETVPQPFMEKMIKQEADRMVNLSYTEKEVVADRLLLTY